MRRRKIRRWGRRKKRETGREKEGEEEILGKMCEMQVNLHKYNDIFIS